MKKSTPEGESDELVRAGASARQQMAARRRREAKAAMWRAQQELEEAVRAVYLEEPERGEMASSALRAAFTREWRRLPRDVGIPSAGPDETPNEVKARILVESGAMKSTSAVKAVFGVDENSPQRRKIDRHAKKRIRDLERDAMDLATGLDAAANGTNDPVLLALGEMIAVREMPRTQALLDAARNERDAPTVASEDEELYEAEEIDDGLDAVIEAATDDANGVEIRETTIQRLERRLALLRRQRPGE